MSQSEAHEAIHAATSFLAELVAAMEPTPNAGA